MLKHIQLTNFQRHRDLRVEFGPGITAVTAANEHGKSTLLRGIAYALFGTKALPDSLDDTVTWGEPVNSLKVELSFEHRGVLYSITRSKGSAELRYADESVTGQTETARFISDLLGADAQLASNLIVANQGDIRGALTGGAKGAVALIEKLADFDQLDQLLDLLAAHLVTGNVAPSRAALEQAQATLAETPEPEPLDQEALLAEVTKLKDAVVGLEMCAQNAQTALKAAEKDRDLGLARVQRARDLEVKIEDRSAALESLKAEQPEVPEWTPVDEGALGVAQRDVQELQESVARLRDRRFIDEANQKLDEKWGAYEDDENERFDGSVSEASALQERSEAAADALWVQAEKASSDAKVKRALIQAAACTLCGRDVSEIPEVVASNAKLEKEAKDLEAEATKLRKKAEYSSDYAKALQAIITAHRAIPTGREWKVENDMTPGRLVWTGGRADPNDANLLPKAQKTLVELQGRKTEHEQAQRAAKAHFDRVGRAEKELQALIDEHKNLPKGKSAEELSEAVAKARERSVETTQAYTDALQETAAFERDVQARISKFEMAQRVRQQAENEVARLTETVKELEFNNALMKAVREARPVVANRLWALVLGAVSEFFSAMRGQPSQVSRGSEGFTVDGHPVSTLSGSTKDILGLAIRVALTRTFLPGISLLMLDEPNAAMDDERTANVLGFLGGAGFDQIVVVSHDEMTVDVADHVVTLE